MVECVCMPMCIEHDCPRPCPICDKADESKIIKTKGDDINGKKT